MRNLVLYVKAFQACQIPNSPLKKVLENKKNCSKKYIYECTLVSKKFCIPKTIPCINSSIKI